jgi:hypothetical protein
VHTNLECLRENLIAFRDVLAEIEKLRQLDIHQLWLRAPGSGQ